MLRCLIFLLILLGLTIQASAHSTLIAVDPPDGSVLAKAPSSVRLRFNEPITPAVIRLIDADGRLRDAPFRTQDNTITIDMPGDLPHGTNVVSYRIISADGHPVAGSVLFSIGAPSGVSSANADKSADPTRAALIWAAKVGLYIGLFAGIGGVFFVRWYLPGSSGHRWLFLPLCLGVLSALLSIGLQGLDLLNLPLEALAEPATWMAGWGTSLGLSIACAIIGFVLGLVALPCQARFARLFSLFGLAAVGATLASSGHAATMPPEWLLRPAIFIHGLCIAFWIGALVPLLILSVHSSAELKSALFRFSDDAVPLVMVLIATGLVMSVAEIGTPAALFETSYGLILVFKLAAVLLMLCLAALNRFRLLREAGRNRELLSFSVAGEVALTLVIFGLVAGWRFATPPRALAAAAAAETIDLHMMGAQTMVSLAMNPGRVGTNSLALDVTDAAGQAFSTKDLAVSFALPSAGIEPKEAHAKLGADGLWHLDGVIFAQPGSWHVSAEVLIDDFKEETVEGEITIGR